MSNDQRYYKITTLHKWFAAGSILLLLVLAGVIKADYDRQYKTFQHEFRTLQVDKVREAYAKREGALEQNPDYQELTKKVEAAKVAVAQRKDDLRAAHNALAERQAVLDRVTKEYQGAKVNYDAARYRYENAKGHEETDVAQREADLAKWRERTDTLLLKKEEADAAVQQQKDATAAITGDVDSLERDLKRVGRDAEVLARKLEKVDRAAMSPANKLADVVRDLPVVNISQPYYKIDQVVLKNVTDDVVFAQVPKVDRCTTCHQGVLDSMFDGAAQPFAAHPNLDLFLSSNSPHPLEDFGCTVCHSGRGRGTTFASAVHSPKDDAQGAKWADEYDWHRYHYWDEPMYPVQYSEAGCFKCHSNQTTIRSADKLNLGMALIEKAGCYGCHTIDVPKWKDRPKVGPGLEHLAAKTNENWAFHWIRDPRGFRANTWMPHFFGLLNNSDPASTARTDQEINAMVHYLFAESKAFDVPTMPVAGDAERGRQLVESVGCMGCHRLEDTEVDTTLESLRLEQGPSLVGLGTKTTAGWVYAWLKDPARYHAATRMPSLRLSDQEAADIATFLVQDKRDDFVASPAAPVDESILDDIVLAYQRKTLSDEQALEKLKGMAVDDKLMYAGQKLIRQYGCFGCHEIPGFEKELPIGTELTEEGSKPLHRFDFGYVDIEETVPSWFFTKLKHPRIYDTDLVKAPDEKLRMPNFQFTDREADALVTVLLGLVKSDERNALKVARTPENLNLERGEAIVRTYNCQGCHTIEGEGSAILPAVATWLQDYQGFTESDATNLAATFGPPNLQGEGRKVQSKWLFGFLHRPEIIRPWLKVRMPTFTLSEADNNALVTYFATLDKQSFPFETEMQPQLSGPEFEAGKTLFSVDYFNCGTCHIQGEKMPPGEPNRWAPNLGMADRRLRSDWIAAWLHNPQAITPGTKMPTYFDPENFEHSGPDNILNGDENAQIVALRDYVLALGTLEPSQPRYEPLKVDLDAAKPATEEQPAQANDDDLWGDAPSGDAGATTNDSDDFWSD